MIPACHRPEHHKTFACTVLRIVGLETAASLFNAFARVVCPDHGSHAVRMHNKDAKSSPENLTISYCSNACYALHI